MKIFVEHCWFQDESRLHVEMHRSYSQASASHQETATNEYAFLVKIMVKENSKFTESHTDQACLGSTTAAKVCGLCMLKVTAVNDICHPPTPRQIDKEKRQTKPLSMTIKDQL